MIDDIRTGRSSLATGFADVVGPSRSVGKRNGSKSAKFLIVAEGVARGVVDSDMVSGVSTTTDCCFAGDEIEPGSIARPNDDGSASPGDRFVGLDDIRGGRGTVSCLPRHCASRYVFKHWSMIARVRSIERGRIARRRSASKAQ